MTLQEQFLTLGLMFGSGAVLGIVFDAYRVLSKELKAPRFLVALLDLAYWAGAALFVFRMLYIGNRGDLRFYVFVGLAGGMLFHYLVTSRAVIFLVHLFLKAAKWVIHFCWRMINLLIVKPLLVLFRILLAIGGFLAGIAMFLLRTVIQLLYPIRALLRYLFKPLLKRLAWPRWLKRWGKRLGQLVRRFFR